MTSLRSASGYKSAIVNILKNKYLFSSIHKIKCNQRNFKNEKQFCWWTQILVEFKPVNMFKFNFRNK